MAATNPIQPVVDHKSGGTVKAFVYSLLVLLMSGCIYDADGNKLKAVTLDDTKLCYPEDYWPGGVSTDVSEQIYVPAQKIKELFPGYIESHVNEYGRDSEHVLRGIVYALSVVDGVSPEELDAWNTHLHSGEALIEPDPELALVRIYKGAEPTSSWDLVTTPPPQSPNGEPPDEWYVGSCLALAGGYSCRQPTADKSVGYYYDVAQQNMPLRHEVREAVIKLLAEWHENCDG